MESEIDGEWEIDDIPIPQSVYVPLSDVDALGVLGEEFEDSKEGGETRREYDEFKVSLVVLWPIVMLIQGDNRL
jgi:hypothetical protein